MRLIQMSVVLAAVGLFSVAAFGTNLYDWVGNPAGTELTVVDPANDTLTGPYFASRDILKVWYASQNNTHFFRMDLAAAPAINASAGAYAIQIDDIVGGGTVSSSNYIAAGLTGIDQLVMSHFSAGTGLYTAEHRHNFTPPGGVDTVNLATLGGVFDTSLNGGATLQWSIPFSQLNLPGPFTMYGATNNIDVPETYDITGSIQAPAVPEPCTLAVMGLGAGLLALRRRKAPAA